METKFVQRWRDQVGSYRPAGEVIDPRGFEVEPMRDDRTAKDFVAQHHYARSYPSARFRFGLYLGGLLHGVAVFSHPMSEIVLTNVFPGAAKESVELGRLVLLDRVAANGETWFLARCFEHLRREGLHGVLSFADPEARTTADGTRIFPGHVGTIYQAFNGVYLGRGRRHTIRLLPDGTAFCDRSISKVRARERNWQSAAALLERHGASKLGEHDDARAWLAHWLPRLTRTLRHNGKHRYAWAFDASVKRHLGAVKAQLETTRGAALLYPKFERPMAHLLPADPSPLAA